MLYLILIVSGIIMAAVAIAVYMCIYRAHANKILQLDREAPRKEYPAPATMLLVLMMCFVFIATVAHAFMIRNNYRSLNENIHDMNEEIDYLSERVSELESVAENSYAFLESVEYEPVSFDETTGIFTVRLDVVPKLSSDITLVAEIDGQEFSFEKEGACYSALISYTFPENGGSSDNPDSETLITLSIRAGETVFTEKLTLIPGDIITMFFLNVDDGSSFLLEPCNGGYSVSGWVGLNLMAAEFNEGMAITEISLVTSADGKKVSCLSVKDDSAATPLTPNWVYGYSQNVEFSIEASESDDIEIYLSIVTEDGYIFEVPCTYYKCDTDGSGGMGIIYSAELRNADGRLLNHGNPAKEAVRGIILPDGTRLK